MFSGLMKDLTLRSIFSQIFKIFTNMLTMNTLLLSVLYNIKAFNKYIKNHEVLITKVRNQYFFREMHYLLSLLQK